ncbi:MAG: OsmC family peroxiredoxin [Deltaproteobacteria bacterium]|nr:MAG: OsmC family peroxiredoxin [Deltaproteobacteria bacterium]
MKITLNAPEDLTLSEFDSDAFEVVATSDLHFSALEIFATGFGLCTASVLISYGEQIGVPTDRLTVRVRWSYAEDPHRIGRFDLEIRWPGLPASRLKAAERAAGLCTVHATFRHPPELSTRVYAEPAASS